MLETEFPHKKLAGSDTFMRAPYMTSHLNFMTSHIAKDGNPGKDRDRFLCAVLNKKGRIRAADPARKERDNYCCAS
jgi:hypothetical protein